ncbi:BURP domain-containing protein 13-like [Panicum virgatum]|nr:BURP domain-containing protein 13-like [Panicum virgatum]
MPAAIADLVQRGIDHSPLVEHYSAQPSISPCILFNSVCDPRMVAETGIFFHEAQLRPGSAMTLSFPTEVGSAILPHDVAGRVPFGNLADVLATFSIPAGSAEAAQVRDTLYRCQEPPVAGEAKACAASLEGTVRSAMGMLGSPASQGGVWAAGGLPRQPHAVEAVTPIHGGHYVSCHRVPLPYAVYQCHIMMGYRAYVASLSGIGGGPAASMLAFCHVDTSSWNPAHPAFEILNTRPGGTPVCHFMPYGDLAFLNKPDKA